MVQGSDDEGQVEGVVEDALGELVVVIGLMQPDVQRWRLRAQRGDHGREQLDRHALKGPDQQPPAGPGTQPVQVGRGGVQPGHDGVGVLKHDAPGGGQLHRARAAGAIEHRLAEGALEAGDLLADRRLREAQLRRRPPERALLGDRPQGEQVADLHIAQGRHIHHHICCSRSQMIAFTYCPARLRSTQTKGADMTRWIDHPQRGPAAPGRRAGPGRPGARRAAGPAGRRGRARRGQRHPAGHPGRPPAARGGPAARPGPDRRGPRRRGAHGSRAARRGRPAGRPSGRRARASTRPLAC